MKRLVRLLLDWFAQNARDLPWRRTRDPYAVWVSEIMLQQTQVKTVIPYWERWMRELPTIGAVAKASPDKIHKLWEGLGYYTRARNLQKAAKQIMQSGKQKAEGGNLFPEKFEEVLALPGIGRYTAGAICSIAFNQPTPILDGNVIRVLTRIFGIAENPKEKKTNVRLWKLAEELVTHAKTQRWGKTPGEPTLPSQSEVKTAREDARPTKDKNCSHLNQSLMELGALVCTPRQPKCPECPVKTVCVAFRENRVEELPNLGKRKAATARRFVAFVVERDGKFLIRQRPAGVVNAHLWEFPNVEIGPRLSEPQHTRRQNNIGKSPATDGTRTRCGSGDPRSEAVVNAATHVLGFLPEELTPLCTIKHSITRYRITLEAFRAKLGGTSCTSPTLKSAKSGARVTRPSEKGVWLTPVRMSRLAFTAAHRKIQHALGASGPPQLPVRSSTFRRPA